jgi:hypothetical protein
LWSFGIFFPFWYVWTKKNLATLRCTYVLQLSKIGNGCLVLCNATAAQKMFCPNVCLKAVLPDGIFQTKNPDLGKFWKVLEWKVLVFYGYLAYFTAKWYMLWPCGKICGYLVFYSVLVCCTEKNLATLFEGATTQRPKTELTRKANSP